MGKLIYAALSSIDGYIADSKGNFEWAEPMEDVHSYINEIEAQNGTLLLGKDMFEILSVWDDIPDIEEQASYIQAYQAAWQASRKIVFSTTLKQVNTANTELKHSFEKAEIQALKNQSEKNIGIGGAKLASHALKLGLIDEIYHFVFPIMVGSGKAWVEASYTQHFERLATQAFANSVVMTHYRVDHD